MADRYAHMFGTRGKKFGIWNSKTKEFQFGICEDTPLLAQARLAQHIGDDARKWKFEARVLPKEVMEKLSNGPKSTSLEIELSRKDREIKALKNQIRQLEAQLAAKRTA